VSPDLRALTAHTVYPNLRAGDDDDDDGADGADGDDDGGADGDDDGADGDDLLATERNKTVET